MARSKEFDREQVLERAMELFWSRGFEATSIGDLTEHLGIGRQSLYDTFGDKHALYVAALDHYKEGGRMFADEALTRPGQLKRHMREVLRATIDTTLETGRACMLLNAAAERCPTDTAVRERFCSNTNAVEEALVRRFRRAREEGELGGERDLRALARYFVTQIYGLQLSARGGIDRRALEQSAEVALSVLD
jgi:TetR/AcrR family transcriptional regulator, transcriptional repressor for nem operon